MKKPAYLGGFHVCCQCALTHHYRNGGNNHGDGQLAAVHAAKNGVSASGCQSLRETCFEDLMQRGGVVRRASFGFERGRRYSGGRLVIGRDLRVDERRHDGTQARR